MAGRLSFSIAINLLTEQFRKGTNKVKDSFRSMQAQALTFAAALGAGGIGLSNMVSKFIEVARETGRVTTALKNVSGSMGQFADSQMYLLQLADKYGQDINILTNSFAKFTATANMAGMSMAEQKKIFESISRAVTAFGLSADDSNGVFLALSQMMGKGKVSAEELRGQLGERLPIAMQAMAKAAGTTVAGLDDLMKQGKLMSAEVLPKFADAINEMLPNVDTNNVESSINRLKNTLTGLVQSLHIQEGYKKIVDATGAMLEKIRTGVAGIIAFVATMVSGKLLSILGAFFGKQLTLITSITRASESAEVAKETATARRIAAEKLLEEEKTAYNTIENGKRLSTVARVRKAETSLAKASLAETKAIEAAKAASAKAAAVASSTAWGKAAVAMKLAMADVALKMKALWSASWPMALLTAIASVIGSLVNMAKEAKRVKNIFADYRKEAAAIGQTAEVAKLKVLQEMYAKAAGDRKKQQSIQAQIESQLGVQIKKEQDINAVIRERIKLLEATASADFYTRKKVEAQDNINRLGRDLKIGGIKQGNFDYMMQHMARYMETGDRKSWHKAVSTYDDHVRATGQKKYADDWEKNLKEMAGYWKIARDASKKIENAVSKTVNSTTTGGGAVAVNTELQQMEAKYAQSLRELNARREVEAMTVDEYNKSYAGITKEALISAMASDNSSVRGSSFAKKLAEDYQKAMLAITAATTEDILSEMENAVSGEDISVAATPILGRRDTTYDYKKSDVDILGEDLGLWKDYKRQLEDAVSEGAEYLVDELNDAVSKVDSLEDALKVAKVQEDIKELSRQLNESIYSGVKDVASTMTRITSAFEELNDVFNSADASEWEKIMAVWNAIINTVDGIMSVMHTIENISAIAKTLSGAKDTSEAFVAGKVAEVAADTGATAAMVANSKIKTMAAMTEMAAKSTAAYAGIPFAGAGLAAGQIAAMTAMIEAAKAAVPAFRDGGIVGGGLTTGDHVIARVNTGEMILNTRQQSNLFKALNGGIANQAGRLSSTVQTKVRAKDLILTINNELKSQGKQPIS